MITAMNRVALVAVAGVFLSAATGWAAAGDNTIRTAGPGKGLVLDVGSKHTVSYFQAEDGKCNLTLMVGEKATDDGDMGSVGARIRVAIDGGKNARIETAEGRSLVFACAQGASAMSVKALDVVAYSAPKQTN